MDTYVIRPKYQSPRGDIKIIKKNKQIEHFNIDKILLACSKSAYRALVPYTEDIKHEIAQKVSEKIENSNKEMFDITEIHNIVENCLDEVNEKIAKSYRDYRNYKRDFVKIMDEVYRKSQSTMYAGDRDNANSNSALVTTIRALECQYLNTGLYEQFFLNEDEKRAADIGYIYVHDKGARRHTFNCCLFDVANVLSNGFEMGNIWYNEPKTLDVAGDVIGDIVLSAAGAQYGGFTIPEVDKILSPYAEKSYRKYYKKYYKMLISNERKTLKTLKIKWDSLSDEVKKEIWMQADEDAKKEAYKDLCKEMEQVFQGWEYKFNTVGSSRGDYPFLTMTFGLATDRFGKLASLTALKVRRNGQGKKGYKKPVLFPKLVFLYDENLHGKGKELEDVFEEGIKTSATTMYPDWLSLTGDSYVAEMYKKYKKVISPMGCRAFLSPWYEKGGMYPADENDVPVFVGRFNLGVVSLNLPMILAKSQRDNTDFYKELDYYLEMIRSLHKRTFEYLGELKASTNPLAYCEGGLYGGNLNPGDKIKPLLKSATASFGITALNELQQLYNGKSLVEDGAFALQVMDYINDKIDQFKEDDGILYAIYGTPAESLCFAGDTMVYAYPENKKIKDLQINDLVYSYNENTKEIELKKVNKVILSNPKAKTVTVWFGNNKIICTPDHPFAIKRNGEIVYINAEFLNKNDELIFYDNYKKVSAVEYNVDIKPVYDIEVDDNHNFFVGENIGVLVHNCGKQVEQFRKEFGIIQNVSSRPYVSNSFHCGVWEDISPIQKQDLEKRFWDKLKGGQIQYVKYPLQYNIGAVRTFVKRAMDYGFYEGVNMSLSYCDDCGYEENDMEVCPRCGSSNLTKIDRMNGYLSYSRVRGDTRLNEAKMAEIKDRKSM